MIIDTEDPDPDETRVARCIHCWCSVTASLFALLRPEEIHSVTGESAMLVKVRTRDTQELDSVLERMYAIEGFTATRSYIALSTYLERRRRSAKE
jgi:DNA-binding Lrp family transcriptional regulator